MSHALRIITLLALLAPFAVAQEATPAELRREIEQLRDDNARLIVQRDQANQRVQAMESTIKELQDRLQKAQQQIDELKNQLAAQPADQTAQQPPHKLQQTDRPAAPTTAAIPAAPLASPASLLQALRKSYSNTFPNPQFDTAEARSEHEKRVRAWAETAKSILRGQTTWRILLTDVEPNPNNRGAKARMTVLDPGSGLAIGHSFLVQVPQSMLLKLQAKPDQSLWDLTLMLRPEPNVTPERVSRGVFEWPEFIGPMAEFRFDFDWQGLKPVATTSDASSAAQQTHKP